MTEDQLEQETLAWLAEVGYTHLYGPDIAPDGFAPERGSYSQVVLTERLRMAIYQLNPHVPTAAREDALQQVLDLETPVLLAANRHFHRLLVNGVPVQYQKEGETRGDFVRLMDFANPAANEWLAVNQFSIKGAKHTRRPDIVLFVNGLPLVLLELKNPADLKADIWQAYQQIETYKEQIPDIFQYNEVLGIKDGKKRFGDTALAMSQAFTLCCTLDEAKAVREEVAFFQAVKVLLTKKEASSQKKINEERELAIRQIISSAVVSEEVVDIFDAVGLAKPNIGILDDAFLNDVRNLPERNLAVELLERLLEGEIKTRFATNVIQNNKFSELLANVIKRYQNRSIETAQVMEELIAMAHKFKEAADRGAELGLNDDELAFYDALANNEASVRELGDETLKKIAHELTEALKKNVSVDWAKRESVRSKLRIMVKGILRKYKYPPVKTETAIQLVLEQAEKLCEDWV